MLQVRDLVKRYEAKGETVTALSGVSVDFPEKGMVFLLGKSGSGKSTLLNISGGLDAPDEGEVIVKGRSTKDFSKSDFDSYRNTYVGFVFQEYNILNELTVAENVALAVELQGRPADGEFVASLLEQVDLKGYADRRPNTLSGGQKQRVAIARALVKNPEIIMADEPTGALDSATGKQVFDTLKKLSREKLVVVVSHDREFAEIYADRIIELKDGKIVSDMTREGDGLKETANLREVSEKKLSVSCGSALTEEDAERVIAFLRRNKGSVVISSEKEEQVPEEGARASFAPSEALPSEREKDTAEFIKSKFPMRYALKMGIAGLRVKPLRLAFTTLLATIAFIVFGFFSTLITFDSGSIAASALKDSAFTAGVLVKSGLTLRRNAETGEPFSYAVSGRFVPEEVAQLQADYPQLGLIPVFTLDQTLISFSASLGRSTEAGSPYYANDFDDRVMYAGFTGFADASYLGGDLTMLAGALPQQRDEVVLSKTVYEVFERYGLVDGAEVRPVASYSDLLGKSVYLRLGQSGGGCSVTVSGIVDTHEDFSAFTGFKDRFRSEADELDDLEEQFVYSLSSVLFVHSGFYEYNRSFDDSIANYNLWKASLNRWQDPYFLSTKYEETSASGDRYQYLFASLAEDRGAKSNTLMEELNGYIDGERDVRYRAPYSFLQEINEGERTVESIFPLLGAAAAVLALFSALLLFNFISASINAKRKDIGILRAVGARGIDVFKIFIVEGLAITLCCFALGCAGGAAACAAVNSVLIAQGLVSYGLFSFGIFNALFVLAIALATALIATAVPVLITVGKKPVEAIRAI